MVSCFFKNRWGRGQPDDIGAINLGDEKFDPDSDKKPRAGQILWIRGLTRLQTQVTIPISLSLFLSLSFSHSLISHHSRSIFSRALSHKQKRPIAADPAGSGQAHIIYIYLYMYTYACVHTHTHVYVYICTYMSPSLT